jgi:hypothetical protein
MKITDYKAVQTRLPPDLMEQISMHAEIYGRSISTEIRFLLVDGLASRKEFEFAKPKREK